MPDRFSIPHHGEVRLSQLCAAITMAPAALRSTNWVSVRSLFVKGKERWVHGSSIMRVGFETVPGESETQEVGPLLLLNRDLRPSDLSTSEALREAFSWPLVTERP